jgi:hypothetical protein
MSDILDDEDLYVYSNVESKINPLTNLPYSRNYYKLRDGIAPEFRGWGKFSSQVNKQDFLDKLERTNIILLTGETGSGKTTQIPKILYEYLEYDKTVLCTQPRRVTTSLIATRVAEELDVKLGTNVGFRYQGSEKEKGGDIFGLNKLYYMTDGTFTSFIQPNPDSMANYGAVIIDEAHVRNVAIDTLIYLIRKVLRDMPMIRTKFIIMSATVDKDIFMNYFKKEGIIHHHLSGATQYPIKDVYLNRSIYEGTKMPLMHVPWHLKRIIRDIYGIPQPKPKPRPDQRDRRDRGDRRDRRDFQKGDRRDRRDFQKRDFQRGDRRDFQKKDRRDFQKGNRRDFQKGDRRDRRDFQKRDFQRGDRRDFQKGDRRDFQKRDFQKRDSWDMNKPKQVSQDRPPRDVQMDSPHKQQDWKNQNRNNKNNKNNRNKNRGRKGRRDIRFGARPSRSESEERPTVPLIEESDNESLGEVISESEESYDSQQGGAEEERPSPGLKKPEGDILVFLPTIRSLTDMQRQVEQFLEENQIKNYRLMTVSGRSTETEKNQAQKAIPGITKFVFATDVAETGITIDNLSYVIDSGIRNQVEYDIKEKATLIGINYISKAASRQRKGRTGRRQAGTCYHLYTEEEHEKLFEDHPKPDLLVSNNDTFILNMIFILRGQKFAITEMKKTLRNFLTPLPDAITNEYIQRFKTLKWIDSNNITILGECAQGSGFRNAVELIHVFLLFEAYRLETPMIADLTMLMEMANQMSVKEYLNIGKEGLPEEFKAKYMNKYGDLFGLYHIYLDYQKKKLPKIYKEYIKEDKFKELAEASKSLLYNTITTNPLCTETQKHKYKLGGEDNYDNYLSAFRQTYNQNEVLGKDLNFNPQRDITFIEGGIRSDKKYFYLDKSIFMQFGKEIRRNYSMIFALEDPKPKTTKSK